MLVSMYINGTAIFLHPKILSAKKQYVLIVKSILLLGLLWYCPTPTPQSSFDSMPCYLSVQIQCYCYKG